MSFINEREAAIQRFQNDESCRVFLISLKAGGVGLNLTAADYVYIVDPWWNPAVEQQAIDRTHRIGQTKPVTIHVPMAIHGGYREHSFDCLLHSLMQRKRRLATRALWPMGDTDHDAVQLQAMLDGGRTAEGGDSVEAVDRGD